MKGILDYVRMEMSENDREAAGSPLVYQPFFLNCQQVQPIISAPYRIHSSMDYEMILPEKKCYRCFVNGQSVRVNPGEFIIIQAGQRHQDMFDPEAPYQTFHFLIRKVENGEELTTLFSPGLPSGQQVGAFPDQPFVQNLIRLIWMETDKHSGPQDYNIRNSLFQALFWKCISVYPEETLFEDFIRRSMNRFVTAQLFRVFEKHLLNSPTLEELCADMGMSRSALNRLTNHLFGLAPLKAYMKFKIGRVQRMMAMNPDLKVKEVSEAFRFVTPFHFSRLFRQYAQYPPSKHLENRRK